MWDDPKTEFPFNLLIYTSNGRLCASTAPPDQFDAPTDLFEPLYLWQRELADPQCIPELWRFMRAYGVLLHDTPGLWPEME